MHLKTILPKDIVYYHIGSTAIKEIYAKPIVDIIIAVREKEQLKECSKILQENSYLLMSECENRISLNKGYTTRGYAEKVYHLHIRKHDDIDEKYFRDYLNAHPKIRKEYENLKLSLWKKYKYDREAYTMAKTDFVKKYTLLSKK